MIGIPVVNQPYILTDMLIECRSFFDLRQHSRLFLVETWSCTFKTHGKEADRISSDSRKNGRDTL